MKLSNKYKIFVIVLVILAVFVFLLVAYNDKVVMNEQNTINIESVNSDSTVTNNTNEVGEDGFQENDTSNELYIETQPIVTEESQTIEDLTIEIDEDSYDELSHKIPDGYNIDDPYDRRATADEVNKLAQEALEKELNEDSELKQNMRHSTEEFITTYFNLTDEQRREKLQLLVDNDFLLQEQQESILYMDIHENNPGFAISPYVQFLSIKDIQIDNRNYGNLITRVEIEYMVEDLGETGIIQSKEDEDRKQYHVDVETYQVFMNDNFKIQKIKRV